MKLMAITLSVLFSFAALSSFAQADETSVNPEQQNEALFPRPRPFEWTCHVRDGRGLRFEASGPDRENVRARAMEKCEAVSVRCEFLGCN